MQNSFGDRDFENRRSLMGEEYEADGIDYDEKKA